MRILIFVAIAVAIFAPFNLVTWRGLTRIHPRRWRWALGALIAGNLMWPFFGMLRSFTPAARLVRAIFGPVWFGWQSFTILYTALLLIVAIAWLPFRRRVRFAELARWPSRIFLATVIVGFFAGWYQAIVPLRVERVTLHVPQLPPGAAGTRIALIGDLHVGLFTRPSRLTKIFSTISSLDPDVTLIAGDMIDDDPHFVPKLLAGTQSLSPDVPLYGVFGNHEMYGNPFAVIDGLRGSRIRLLVNEGVAFRGLWITGVSDPAADQAEGGRRLEPDLPAALAGKPADAIPIVLAHQPKILEEARRRGMPVVLCAHTHGGQLGFRPLGWSLAGVFLRYHMGLYDLPPTQLYINTGTGYWLFPFRLGMTPEITLIELR